METIKKKKTINKLSQITILKQLEYCKLFNQEIKAGATGPLSQLAAKFDITSSLASEIIKAMIEDFHCPIQYNEDKATYYYQGKGELIMGYFPFEQQ